MAIKDILRALEEQARLEREAVLTEAHEHARLILDEADGRAELLRDEHRRAVERAATADATKCLNAARLEGHTAISSVRGEGVQRVFDAALERLSGARSDPGYERLFVALATEAFAGLQGHLVVRVAPVDAGLAASAIANAGVDAEVREDLETMGGLVVESQNGRVVRRNTLEDRLERARAMYQSDVAKVLLS
jgi:V/A-type H+/Na+-transporting ATPase subunit E